MGKWGDFKWLIEKPNLELMFEEIKIYIEKLETNNKKLVERLQSYNKDEEVQKAKEEAREVRRASLYMLSESEKVKANEWIANHKTKGCNCRYHHYEIHPLGIGTAVYMVCNKCGDRKDIGDGL